MRRKAIGGCLLLFMLMFFSACTDIKGPIQTGETTSSPKNTKQTETSKPNILEVGDFTSDCSKVVIPSNVEWDTNFDKDKGLVTVHWYDDSKGKDVGVVFRFKDQNCSESAKELIQHLLESEKEFPAKDGTVEEKYIERDVAINIAKGLNPRENTKWEATFEKDWQVDPDVKLKGRPVWIVKGIYSSGNESLVVIDSVSGKQLAVNEIKVNSCQLILDTDLLKTAKKGQLKGIKANLSSSKSNLEESYGKPDEIGFDNAEYLKYDNCYFYIWDENKIGVIDLKINFSVEKVKEVLGKPDFEGNPDAGFDEYVLGYKTDEYYLYFKYRDKESTLGILRFKKP